jgi:general secretion pathway protein D
MKTTTFVLILLLTGLDLWAQTVPSNNVGRLSPRLRNTGTNSAAPAAMPVMPVMPATPGPATIPAAAGMAPDAGAAATADENAQEQKEVPAYEYNFQGVDVSQVLDIYAQLVGRTVLRGGLPAAQIILKTQSKLTKTEAIQALQAVLAINGIAVVNVGDKFVKIVPAAQANQEGAAFNNADASQLPDLGSYVTHIVQLKYTKPSEMVPLIQPFAKLNSIVPIDSNGILVIRDYAENVKRMLEMIARVDVSVPAVYISEVIPIKYALADDIANALNSLGGSGNSTVSFGGSGSTGAASGARGGAAGGSSTFGQNNQNRGFGGTTTANGTPNTGTTFQQRIQSIIQRASTPGGGGQQDQIQVFGQTKIIADQRSNSLLVFATAADMERIKAVVDKLDVLLSQVLIESVIMDVGFGSSWTLGASAAQNPKAFSPSQQIVGGGGVNNGQTFFNFLTNSAFALGTNSSTVFGNVLPGGLSYFGNIGPTWDVALQAAAQDNTVTVIQRPRIQTSQAKAASFFVGQTVPYVTSTYAGGTVGGNSSSYSQLSVGVELDITPFINPDGLVVMDIQQEIDDLNGSTYIQGVGNVPNTTKRTLSSEIAVRDRDTIMLGGFIRTDHSKTKSGVPLLQDIPLLGALFSQRSDTKDRSETLVLIRPTVLRTPEIAAEQAVTEQRRLPGITAAAAEEARDERKLLQSQNKQEQRDEQRDLKTKKNDDPFFAPLPEGSTNTPAPSVLPTAP